MIKHRKIIICFLLSYALFIVGIFNVNAQVLTNYYQYSGSLQDRNYFWSRTNFSINGNGTYQQIWRNVQILPNNTDNIYLTGFIQLDPSDSLQLSCTEQYGNVCQKWAFWKTLNLQVLYGNSPCSLSILNMIDNNVQYSATCLVNGNYSNNIEIDYMNKNGSAISVAEIGVGYFFSINGSTEKNIENNTGEINNKISDSSIDTNQTTTDTSSWSNMNTTDSTITNLLTLPIQLLQAYTNGMSGTCSSFNLGNLFGTNITLPCINIGNLIGNSLWTTIDVLFSGFMTFAIAKKLIKIFNDFTNLRSNQVDELYGGGA